ncbi:unnamed protein product [Amoebophrya sp. A120]|nr:unnamed protein product [Amoebophrya sp. A120]|eukprot:GSA120T00018830001.1
MPGSSSSNKKSGKTQCWRDICSIVNQSRDLDRLLTEEEKAYSVAPWVMQLPPPEDEGVNVLNSHHWSPRCLCCRKPNGWQVDSGVALRKVFRYWDTSHARANGKRNKCKKRHLVDCVDALDQIIETRNVVARTALPMDEERQLPLAHPDDHNLHPFFGETIADDAEKVAAFLDMSEELSLLTTRSYNRIRRDYAKRAEDKKNGVAIEEADGYGLDSAEKREEEKRHVKCLMRLRDWAPPQMGTNEDRDESAEDLSSFGVGGVGGIIDGSSPIITSTSTLVRRHQVRYPDRDYREDSRTRQIVTGRAATASSSSRVKNRQPGGILKNAGSPQRLPMGFANDGYKTKRFVSDADEIESELETSREQDEVGNGSNNLVVEEQSHYDNRAEESESNVQYAQGPFDVNPGSSTNRKNQQRTRRNRKGSSHIANNPFHADQSDEDDRSYSRSRSRSRDRAGGAAAASSRGGAVYYHSGAPAAPKRRAYTNNHNNPFAQF